MAARRRAHPRAERAANDVSVRPRAGRDAAGAGTRRRPAAAWRDTYGSRTVPASSTDLARLLRATTCTAAAASRAAEGSDGNVVRSAFGSWMGTRAGSWALQPDFRACVGAPTPCDRARVATYTSTVCPRGERRPQVERPRSPSRRTATTGTAGRPNAAAAASDAWMKGARSRPYSIAGKESCRDGLAVLVGNGRRLEGAGRAPGVEAGIVGDPLDAHAQSSDSYAAALAPASPRDAGRRRDPRRGPATYGLRRWQVALAVEGVERLQETLVPEKEPQLELHAPRTGREIRLPAWGRASDGRSRHASCACRARSGSAPRSAGDGTSSSSILKIPGSRSTSRRARRAAVGALSVGSRVPRPPSRRRPREPRRCRASTPTTISSATARSEARTARAGRVGGPMSCSRQRASLSPEPVGASESRRPLGETRISLHDSSPSLCHIVASPSTRSDFDSGSRARRVEHESRSRWSSTRSRRGASSISVRLGAWCVVREHGVDDLLGYDGPGSTGLCCSTPGEFRTVEIEEPFTDDAAVRVMLPGGDSAPRAASRRTVHGVPDVACRHRPVLLRDTGQTGIHHVNGTVA